MSKPRQQTRADQQIPLQRSRAKELKRRIKHEDDIHTLQRLVFIKRLYEGDSVWDAAEKVHLSEAAGYKILEQWDGNCSKEVISSNKGEDTHNRRLSDHQQCCIVRILEEDDHL
jgi:transposase